MKLSVAGNVGWLEVSNGSFIDNAWRNLTRSNQVSGPRIRV